jgi:peptide/nickel transport system substrate-binding protein
MSLRQARTKLADPKTDQGQYDFLKPFLDLNRPIFDLDYAYIGTVHPQHVLSLLPIDKIQESTQGQKPTSYGPYIVKEWKQGDSLSLTANPNYNLTAKPLINTITSRFNPDVAAQANAYLTGEVDGIASEGFVVPPDQADLLQKAGAVISAVPGSTIEYLSPRIQDAADGYTPFNELAVRQALAFAINRDQIIKVVYKGTSAIAKGIVPPSTWYSLDNLLFAEQFPDLAKQYNLPNYDYNPQKAKELLESSGWIDVDGDGVREKNGQRLTFEYATTRNTTRQAVMALVGIDLSAIGMDPVITTYPISWQWSANEGYITGKIELAQFALIWGDGILFDRWTSAEWPTASAPNNINYQHYSNPKVDTANALFKTSVSAYERAEQSAIIQTELMNDAAIIPLAQRANIEIYSGKMQNRKTPNNSTATGWWNVGQWYFVP